VATITNVINTNFKSTGADKVTKDVDTLSRSTTRLGQSSAGNARQFAAQASGLGGLVAAYAGAAATIFALQASFDALARSARALQTLEGLGALANTFGQNANDLLSSVRDITKGQLTIAETAQQINLSLSAGFNTEQIEGLAGVALKASRALGRDLSDSFTRVVRGSAKLETELLDELGIFTKIEPATAAYAAQLGKSRLALTEFERRQAFVNSVIAEGERKFSSINTTLPTTAEQIEAFGVKIIDLATQIGGLLAETLAPLANFLTNNLAGAFAAVGTVAGLVAAKGISLLKGSLDEFAQTSVTRGAQVEQFFLRYSAAARAAREEAQKDITTINLTKGLERPLQKELGQLKEAAAVRTLTGAELDRVKSILEQRQANLLARKEQESAALQTAATTEEIKKQTTALNNTNLRLEQTAKSLKLLEVSSAGAASTIARAASTAVTGFINLGAGIARTGANLVGFAGNALSIVSVLSLVGASIASAIGKQEEYNAVLAKFGSLITNFFTSKAGRSIEKGLLSISADALSDLEKVDPELKAIEEFRFSTKFLGVEIDVVKTKEDLIREVSAALAEAAQAGSKTFGEQLSDNVVGVGAGALIGQSLGSSVGVAAGAAITAKVGGTLGSTLGAAAGPVGVVVGGLLGAGIGFGISKFFGENDLLPEDVKKQLEVQFGANIFAGDQGAQLAIALQKIEEQAGAAKNLSFEGRKYYETQVELAVQLSSNLGMIREQQQLAEKLGVELSLFKDRFEIEVTDGVLKLDPKLKLDIPISFKIIDQEEVIKAADRITEIANRARESAAGTPERVVKTPRGTFTVPAQLSEFEQKLKEVNELQTRLVAAQNEAANQTIDNTSYEALGIAMSTAAEEAAYLTTQLTAAQKELGMLGAQKELTEALVTTLGSLSNAALDAGDSLLRAQTSALQTESALATLDEGITNGTLSLETLAQAEGSVVSALSRTETQVEASAAKLSSLIKLRNTAEKQGASTEVLTLLDGEIARISTLQNELNTNIILQQRRYEAVREVARAYEEEIKAIDAIKRTFGDLVNLPLAKLGDLDAQGNYILGVQNRQLAQYQQLNEAFRQAADKKAAADATLEKVRSVQTGADFIATAEADAAKAGEVYNSILNVRINLARQVGDELVAGIEKFENTVSNLAEETNNKLAEIARNETIAKINFEIDKADIALQGVEAAAAFEQAFRENQIRLIELQVDNKKLEPVDGATQINALKQEIQDIQSNLLADQRIMAAEQYSRQQALLGEEYRAKVAQIDLEAKQSAQKIQAEYQVLADTATTYNSLTSQLQQAAVDGGNAMGRSIVNAINAGVKAFVGSFGKLGGMLGLTAQEASFAPAEVSAPQMVDLPSGQKISEFDLMLGKLEGNLTTATNSVELLAETQRETALESYTRDTILASKRRELEIAEFERKVALLAQEENISKEQAEKRLRDAKEAGGGDKDRELTALEERLKALFSAIKGNIENTLMSLNNLIFYGEGNFKEIMGSFFKNLQQDFFKTTVAEPVSDFLTTSLFSALGVEGAGVKKGTKGLTYDGNSLLVRVTNAFDFMNPAADVTNVADVAGEKGKGIFGGFFDQITGLFGKIFGQGGFLSKLFGNLFGNGGVLSGLFKGIGGFFTSLLGFSQGGLVHLAAGGAAASATINRDRVPAMLEPGEFVIRKQSAERIGMPALQAMNATGEAGMGSGNVFVNLTNEGSPKQAEASAPRFDGEKYVVDIVMRDFANNGPIRRTLRGRGGL
jgi:hypothetical protein